MPEKRSKPDPDEENENSDEESNPESDDNGNPRKKGGKEKVGAGADSEPAYVRVAESKKRDAGHGFARLDPIMENSLRFTCG